MGAPPDAGTAPAHLPLHRLEALTDGIFAVAMTLLVIELKLPAHSGQSLAAELTALLPRALAWVMSFFVLALFWVGHHRVASHLGRVDATLVWLNLVELALVSLMPFSSALVGEHGVLLAQVVYSANMAALAAAAFFMLHHVYRHPELANDRPMGAVEHASAALRLGALMVISVAAVVLSAVVPMQGGGNLAFLLMAVLMPMSRRLGARWAG